MARKDNLIAHIALLGARRADARRTAIESTAQIAKLARAAHKAGATKTSIAQAAQISRPTLDEMLKH